MFDFSYFNPFAVLSLILGIPIEAVRSILGHSSLMTKQIAKVVDELKEREMKNGIFEGPEEFYEVLQEDKFVIINFKPDKSLF